MLLLCFPLLSGCLALAQSSEPRGPAGVTARYLGALERDSAGGANPRESAGPLAVSAFPPPPAILSFNAAEVGIVAGSAQQLTASFSVSGYSGSFTPTATLHYGHDYTAGAVTCVPAGASETCNVPVTFQPSLPGARKDAIFLMDGSTRLATVLLNGVGQGPLLLVQPGAFSTSVPTNDYLYQSVADEDGVVYILPSGNSPYIERVTKAGVASQIALTNPPYFWSIGIDGAGVLYIFGESATVTTYDTVQGIQGTYQVPNPGMDTNWYPGVLGEDGTTYIVDQIHNNGTAYAFKPDGSTLYADILNPGVLQPNTAAVDSAGNLFVGGYEINKITPAGVQTQVNTVGASEGLAVDAADTLYATRYNPTDGVAELAASDYSTPIASFGRSSPLGMSLGSDGTLYVSNYVNLDIFDRSTTETIDFGEVDAGKSSTLSTASIYNGGNQPLSISGFGLSELSDAGFSLDFSNANECTYGIVLAPGSLCQVSVVFAPTHPGTFSGTISISSNTLNEPIANQTIQLAGISYGSYDVLTPSPLVFAAQAPGTSKTLAVTLTNKGNFYASTVYSVATDNPAFTIAQGTCSGVAIAVGSSCQLQVTFTPTAGQAYSGTATVVTYVSGTGQPFQTITLPLSGTGSAPPPVASLAPSSLSFSAAAGTTSAAQMVTLSNTGSAPLTIGGIVAVSSPLAGLFNESNNCGASLAAGASCTISVTFSPVTTGSVTGTLLVTDNAAGSPQPVALSGTGTPAPVPVVSLSPASLSFSATAGTTSAAQAVTLSNTGKAPLTISGILAGSMPLAGLFNETSNCGASLAAGSSCTISVTFSPVTTGSVTGTLLVTDNAAGSPQPVALSGTGTAAPVPVVSLSPSSLSFSATAGTTSAAQTVTLSNTGKAPLTISGILAGSMPLAGLFNETSNCGASLAAGASCTISVTFSPVTTGSVTGTLLVTDNAAGSPQPVALSGTGTAAPVPVVSLSPSSLSFSATAGTTSAAQTVTLSNTGKAPLTISGILAGSMPLAGLFNETSNCGASLAAGASCTISVTFSPVTTGSVTGTLLVTDNAAGSPQPVALSGTGTAAPVPVVSLSPSSLSFSATAGTTSAVQTVMLSNTGKAPLTISGILAVSSPLAGLFNESNNCGASLAAGSSCTISVTFSPVTTGSVTGSLLVTDNAAGSPQPVALSGTGTAAPVPVVSLSPSSLSFSATAGTTSAVQTVMLSNTGKAPLTISGILAVSSPLAGLFNESNNCGASLAAGSSCTISVTFSPVTTGSVTGTLLVTDNAAGSPQPVALSGTGTAAPVPVVSLSPASLSFSATAGTTSAAQAVTLSNTGKAPLTIGGIIAVSSPLAGLFNETSNCGASLASGSSCTISVTFSPVTTGSVTGTLLVTDNAAGSPQPVALSGTGTAAPVPVVSLSPASLSFSATAGTASAAQVVTLSNTGKAPLTISGILAGSMPLAGLFNETSNCGASLAAGASCTIWVTFSPVATGSVTGTLLVTDNAAGSPQPVALSGTGTAAPVPVVSLSPASLSFSATAGTTSAAQMVTLSNTGKAPLTITGIQAGSMPLAGLFNESSNCGASLAAGESCTISVTFSPVVAGSVTGTLLVTDNAAGSPQSITLLGDGTNTPDFVVASSTPPQIVLPGGSAQFLLTVTAENGASIPAVTLAATGLPPGATAAFSRSTVTPGITSATSTLTIETTTKNAAKTAVMGGSHWPLAAPALALAGFFFLPAKRRRRWAALGVLAVASLGALATLSGCGGSSLPPPKSYNVTVSATIGKVQQTCTVQLTVR